jgi:TPR repeat protein
MNNLGTYYKKIKDYDNMKKYFLMAIEHKNVYAMFNLALYYKRVEKNAELTTKYFLMADEYGDKDALLNLGFFFKETKDYNQMKYYFLKAIDKGNRSALCQMGNYYRFIQINEPLMIWYYLEAIAKDCVKSMYNLADYYYLNHDYNNMLKYCLMAIKTNDSYVPPMFLLEEYYRQIINDNHFADQYNSMAFKKCDNIDTLCGLIEHVT